MYFCAGVPSFLPVPGDPVGRVGVVARYDGLMIPIHAALETKHRQRKPRIVTPDRQWREDTFRRRCEAWVRVWDRSSPSDFPTSGRRPKEGVRRPTADRVMALASKTHFGILEGKENVRIRRSTLVGIGNWRPRPSLLRHEVASNTQEIEAEPSESREPPPPTTLLPTHTLPEDAGEKVTKWLRGTFSPLTATQYEPRSSILTQPLGLSDPNTAQRSPRTLLRFEAPNSKVEPHTPTATQDEPPFSTMATQVLAHHELNTPQLNPSTVLPSGPSTEPRRKGESMFSSLLKERRDPSAGKQLHSTSHLTPFPSTTTPPFYDIFSPFVTPPAFRFSARLRCPPPRRKPLLLAMKELQPILDRHHAKKSKRVRGHDHHFPHPHPNPHPHPHPSPARSGCTNNRNQCSTHHIQFGSQKRKMAETLLLHYPFGVRAGDVQHAVGFGQECAPAPTQNKRKVCDEAGRIEFGGPRKAFRPSFLTVPSGQTIERWGTDGPCSAGGMPARQDVSLRLNSSLKRSHSKPTPAAGSMGKKRGAEEADEARKARTLDPPTRRRSPLVPRSSLQVHTQTVQRHNSRPTEVRALCGPRPPIPFPWPRTV